VCPSQILTNIALLIQKYSAQVESGKPLYKRWRFIFGFLLNTGSEIGLSAPASLFAPLSLLAPLGGVAVVVNALLTRFGCVCGIKERLSFLEWLATFFVMCGVALVAFSGAGGNTQVRSWGRSLGSSGSASTHGWSRPGTRERALCLKLTHRGTGIVGATLGSS
jgi:drug/metabolite transporter (DMT)-like permease